jgi:hypothetical protein
VLPPQSSDRKTHIDLPEFLAIVYSELIDQAQPTDLVKSFSAFDRDGNGEVDMDEFEGGLVALGDMNPLDRDGHATFIAKLDVDGNAALSARELINWLAHDTFELFKAMAARFGSSNSSHHRHPRNHQQQQQQQQQQRHQHRHNTSSQHLHDR